MEGTEPRIRLVSGYQKKLQDAVNTSLTYIDELVETIPAPVQASQKTFVSDFRINAYFTSVEDLHRIFQESQELKSFFSELDNRDYDEAYALLCMCKTEKQVTGVEVNGDMLRRDVLQTTVNFYDHKILSPAATERGIRQGLKQCIFDGMITHALQGITSLKTQQGDLQDRRRILHAKLRARLSQGSGLNQLLASAFADKTEVADIEERLADTEKQLKDMPVNRNAPLGYLNEVKDILSHPEALIKLEITPLTLNRMSIKVDEQNCEACSTIQVAELEIANVLKRVVAIVRYPRVEMTPGY